MVHQRKGENRADYIQRGKDEYRAKHPLQTIAVWRKVEHMTPQERAAFFVIDPKVEHTPLWIQTRDSFNGSKEWHNFTKEIKRGVIVCPICNRAITKKTASYITGNVGRVCFQVHHRAGYELDKRVIEHGFLYDLKDKSKFAVICSDCHYTAHKDLIVGESKVVHVDYDGLSVRQVHIKSIARVKAKNTDIMEVK
jgi:hypothetical protein